MQFAIAAPVQISDGIASDFTEETAMQFYDHDIWSDYADTTWYTQHKKDNTFSLSTPEEFAGLAVLVSMEGVTFQGKTIKLAADMDLKGHQWFPIGCNEATYWGLSPFKGTFDGAGHQIRNIYIENGYHGQALFGVIRDAELKNFSLYGSITTGWQAAGVVAEMERSTLSNIQNYADVRTLFKSGDGGYSSTAGGIVAYVIDTYVNRSGATASRLENLKNYGTVECGGITEQGGGVGGIAGSLGVSDDDLSIVVTQCENHGTVQADASNYTDMYIKGVGGIVGSTATYGNYLISDCSNTGAVSSANLPSTGGVVGSISGLSSSVEYCYNAGTVTGSSPDEIASTGGIVGRHVSAHTGNTQFDLISCYNVGDVSGRGKNVSALLGSTSGFAEDWDNNNDGGTTVHTDANYYVEGSVAQSNLSGVLFQTGTVDAGQPVSRERMNTEDVIQNLNSTDATQDHYVTGKETPKLELSGISDRGTDDTHTQGDGADDATLAENRNANQKETHLYAVRMDDTAQTATAVDIPHLVYLLIGACIVCVLAGLVLQGRYYRRQMRPQVVVDATGKE